MRRTISISSAVCLRILIAAAALSFCTGTLRAGGKPEEPVPNAIRPVEITPYQALTFTDSEIKGSVLVPKSVTCADYPELGIHTYKLTVEPDGCEKVFLLVHIKDAENGTESWQSFPSSSVTNQELAAIVSALPKNESLTGTARPAWCTALPVNGQVYAGTLPSAPSHALTSFGGKTLNAEFCIGRFGESVSLKIVLLMNRQGRWHYELFSAEKLYAFHEEEALFSKLPLSYTYREKVLGALTWLFGKEHESDADRFIAYAVNNLEANANRLNTVRSEINKDSTPEALRIAYLTGLRREMMSYFNFKLEKRSEFPKLDLPYLEIDPRRFEALYGGNRNLYVEAYLGALYDRGKPVLSRSFFTELKRPGVDLCYRYGDYEPIGEDEGREIADLALRFLTWGVEYTLPNGSGSAEDLMRGDPERLVYSSCMDSSWLMGGADGLARERNYAEAVYTVSLSGVDAQGTFGGPAAKQLFNGRLTTPFKIGGTATLGNPIPYATWGIDGPRTFNYKMYEQVRLRTWLRIRLGMMADYTVEPTSLALGSSPAAFLFPDFRKYYADEQTALAAAEPSYSISLPRDAFRYNGTYPMKTPTFRNPDGSYSTYKPFLPGLTTAAEVEAERLLDSKAAASSPYAPDKAAGVDSLGLLGGVLAMSGLWNNIENAVGRNPAEALDDYYRMELRRDADGRTVVPAGLDAAGLPCYYTVGGNESFLSGGYRFTRSDIERMTVLVPDVSLVRPGDLLVCYAVNEGHSRMGGTESAANGEPHVGIVAAVDWTETPAYRCGGDPASLMRKVYVVSVRRGFRTVNLGMWGNPEGIFGGFSTNPEAYQIRRLVKRSTSASGRDTADAWELIDPGVAQLKVAVEYEPDRYYALKGERVENRWIANTGEPLIIRQIRLTAVNSAGEPVNLSQEENKVVILPPLDRYGELALAGNISDNKGEGIELLALVGDVPVKLAGFSLKSEGGYRVDTGAVTEGLFIEGGKLVYRYRAGGAVKTSSVFALRVKSGTICPGDDFLLRFGLAENESIVGTAAAADYCAVYDKKLLWRANLYIDEGGGDWNNVHQWNAPASAAVYDAMSQAEKNKISWWKPEYGYNEWNRTHDGVTPFNGLSELSPGQGNQSIQITAFAPLRSAGAGGAAQISGKVAYSYPQHPFEPVWGSATTAITKYVRLSGVDWTTTDWFNFRGYAGSMDSPFDFNSKLLKQMALRGAAAPVVPAGNSWWSYSNATETGVTTGILNGLSGTLPANATNLTGAGAVASRAFIPGLGLWYGYPNSAFNSPAPDGAAAQNRRGSWIFEAGTDCIGFAQRAAGYAGRPYVWRQLPLGMTERGNPAAAGTANVRDALDAYDTTEPDGGNRTAVRVYPRHTGTEVYSDLIIEHTVNQNFADMSQDALRRVIPGDIFYWDLPTSKHIAIVNNILYDVAGNVAGINLIESTFDGTTIQYVTNTTTIRTEQSPNDEKYRARNYFIIRLKVRSI